MPASTRIDSSWEYLLAHHTPARYSRTLTVPVRSRAVHLCARCTGQLIGLLAFFYCYLRVDGIGAGLGSPALLLGIAALPAPAALDWILQALGRRESNNTTRLITGFALGIAVGVVIALLLRREWLYLVASLAVIFAYFVALVETLRRTGAWRHVLEEHFPGIEIPAEM
jgi:uncharacterized membrane protein